MSRILIYVQTICLVALLLAGCQPTVSPQAAPANGQPSAPSIAMQAPTEEGFCPVAPGEPDFGGLWIGEDGRVVYLTKETLYLRQPAFNDPTGIHETWAEITAGTLTVRYMRLAVNGQSGGFDSPTHLVKYNLEADTLYLGISPLENEIPAELELIAYQKKG